MIDVRNLSGQHGLLLIVEKVNHGGRAAYICRCSKCGGLTKPRRACSVLQHGAGCGTRKCTHGMSKPRAAHTIAFDDDEKQTVEQADDPVWRTRALALARLVLTPTKTVDMVRLGTKLGWTRALLNEVLASASGVELVKSHGLWSASRLHINLGTA